MIEEFLLENWQTIIITFIFGLIFFFVSIYFLRYKEKSAEYERYKKAKETVIGVLESSLINKKPISLNRIYHLISASEREQKVEIKDSPKELLEDLELRFEISKHLDPEQQKVYIDQIEETISKIESQSKIISVPAVLKDIYSSLKENIELGRKDDALEDLDKIIMKIRSSYLRRELSLAFIIMNTFRNPKKLAIFLLVYLIVIFVALYIRGLRY